MDNKPLVSVIIPTYNRNSVFRAVESVLAQDYTSIEIVVINDSPIDTVGDGLREKYPELIYFHDGINRGGGGARKKGVEIASGTYISFLDDDDYYYPEKIDFLLSKIVLDSSVDACFGMISRSDKLCPQREWHVKNLSKLGDISYLHTNTSLIKSSVFEKINFDPELRKFQDTYFHILLISRFKVMLYSRPVAVWNVDNRHDQITHLSKARDYILSYKQYRLMVFKLLDQKLGFAKSSYLLYRLVRNCIKSYLFAPVIYFFKRHI